MTGDGWVAIVGRDASKIARLVSDIEAKPDWRRQDFTGSASIFTQPGCPYVAAPDSADVAVLGITFAGFGNRRHLHGLESAAWGDLRHGSAARFLEQCWGGFVALSSHGRGLQVTRDPSGAMPCYYAEIYGTVLIGSSVAAMMEAGLKKPCVVMNHVARSVFRSDLPSPETALEGIHELLPGNSLRVDGDNLNVQSVWSPWDHTTIDDRMTFDEHAERLEHIIRNVVSAWGNAVGQAIAGVSGGLDSSIVATCLASISPQPMCLTVSTDDAEGNELLYAQRICDHLGLPLIESHYDLGDIQIERPARPHLPRPTGRLIAQAYNAAVFRTAQEQGSRAFFTGNGGDNVFAYSQSAGAIADRMLHDGLGPAAWKTAKDICHLTGCNLIQAWRSALRIATGARRYIWKPDREFLHREILQGLDRQPLAHPWLDTPKGALPGKAAHIAALLRIQRHLEGTGQFGAVRVVNPLMSQPVIEACLSIPSWMWCEGGQNRSVARRAFRKAMPAAITGRLSKGGPSGFGGQIISKFRDSIIERLLDGRLATSGIVDRIALERRLRDERPNWSTDQVRILELLEAEAWIEHWR